MGRLSGVARDEVSAPWDEAGATRWLGYNLWAADDGDMNCSRRERLLCVKRERVGEGVVGLRTSMDAERRDKERRRRKKAILVRRVVESE